MNPIETLHALGQSLWYDNIQRKLLENGELAKMITDGDIRGVTSNPTIFNNAISKSTDYDTALAELGPEHLSPVEIFFRLAIEDIQAAADLFRPLYDATNGGDGYVSLEVNPLLAHDTEATIQEAKWVWSAVNRPNLMVKIPATKAGIPAVRAAIAAGVNVNVTLIFSNERYSDVMEAYLSGLEDRVKQGLPIDRIASVASFFVSRVDSKIDPKLDAIVKAGGAEAGQAKSLLGKAAIANARLAFALFKDVFGSERFLKLQKLGARYQRPLWASTGTKNPAYSDVIYVDELIAPNTVNTVPPQTLAAFKDHGKVRVSLEENLPEQHQVMADLEKLGISMIKVTDELEAEGVKSFISSFEELLKTIETRAGVPAK